MVPLISILVRSNRALINVWIPSVFLRGKAANAFHVYQVSVWGFMRISCLESHDALYVGTICVSTGASLVEWCVAFGQEGRRMYMEFPIVALCCCCSVTLLVVCGLMAVSQQHHTLNLSA